MRKGRGLGTRGATLVLMIAVMAVIMALATSILLASSQLLATSQTGRTREQARIAAQSLSGVVEDQLTGKGQGQGAGKVKPNGNANDLTAYLYHHMTVFDGNANDWTYYNAGEAGQTDLAALTRAFSVKPEGMDDRVTATIEMYWESNAQAMYAVSGVQLPERYRSVTLTILSGCEIDGESYTVKSRYVIVCGDDDTEGKKAAWALLGSE